METRTVGYLIERIPQQTPTLYLGVVAGNSDSTHACIDYFSWMQSHTNALRFSRITDATVFVGAMRALSLLLPHGSTLVGLRDGDQAPLVTEHVWIGNKPESDSPPIARLAEQAAFQICCKIDVYDQADFTDEQQTQVKAIIERVFAGNI